MEQYMKENKNINHEYVNELFKKNNSFKIVLKYGIFGVSWILLSDNILYILSGDFETYKLLQTYKGWLYVIITMIFVYILIHNRDKKIREATSESLKAMNELEHMAYYDTLTGLPNRAMLASHVKKLIIQNKKFAIALLNIDNFKYINDTVGHAAGDEYLKFMGNKLSAENVLPNMVARLGSDEFVILINDYESDDLLLHKLETIKNNMGKTWNSHAREFFISVSIGISEYPNDCNDFDTLIKNSDIAKSYAKKNGKGKILFFDESINKENLYYINMANEIQKGLDNEEFELYYQPQISLISCKVVGVEALVRWCHLNEFIPPGEFIPVAESTGQIYELERRILRNVLIQKQKWEAAGLKGLIVSINLSSKSLLSSENFKKIKDIFLEYNMDYSDLVIEVTETAAISDINIAIERLNVLKDLGLKVALDDFGTGYSSLKHLVVLPIDIIKIDKSYVNFEYGNTKGKLISKFIVSLAHDLGFNVIAEGIETPEQLEYMKSIDSEYGQGYYLDRPMNLNKINELLLKTFKNPED